MMYLTTQVHSEPEEIKLLEDEIDNADEMDENLDREKRDAKPFLGRRRSSSSGRTSTLRKISNVVVTAKNVYDAYSTGSTIRASVKGVILASIIVFIQAVYGI